MRLLLDSHTLIWSADQPERITPGAIAAMSRPGERSACECGNSLGDRYQVRPGKATAVLAVPSMDGEGDG